METIDILSSGDETDSNSSSYEPKPKKMKLLDTTAHNIDDIHQLDNDIFHSTCTLKDAATGVEVVPDISEDVTLKEISDISINNEVPAFFKKFIALCIMSIKDENIIKKAKTKIAVICKTFNKAAPYSHSDEFKNKIDVCMRVVRSAPNTAVEHIAHIFEHLKSNRKSKTNSKLDNLYDKLEKLKYKIQEFEADEVDFDDEDSSYIKMQRYRQRAVEVYEMIKRLEKSDPHRGSVYYSRLDYSHSMHIEINKAINKAFNSRKKIPFPTFEEVDLCIRECVANSEKLMLSENQIVNEVKSNFEHLGNLIQRKRKQELLLNHHESYIKDAIDPALNDPELEMLLKRNDSLWATKLDETFQKFTDVKWDEQEMSDDLDDSEDDSVNCEDEMNV